MGILEINPAIIELIIKENKTLTLKMHNRHRIITDIKTGLNNNSIVKILSQKILFKLIELLYKPYITNDIIRIVKYMRARAFKVLSL